MQKEDLMSFQGAIAAQTLSTFNFDIDGDGLSRSNEYAKPRRKILNRVLLREHKNLMRAAMLGASVNNEEEIQVCPECGNSLENCACCPECFQLQCMCGDGFDDGEHFLKLNGGANLEEAVTDLNKCYRLPVNLQQLKLSDFFWNEFETRMEWERHLFEMGYCGDIHNNKGTTDMRYSNDADDDLFSPYADPQPVGFLPVVRGNFRQLQGGRLKRFTSRRGGHNGGSSRSYQSTSRADQRERSIIEAEAAETMAEHAEIANANRLRRYRARAFRLVDVFVVVRKSGPHPVPVLKGYVMGDCNGNRFFAKA